MEPTTRVDAALDDVDSGHDPLLPLEELFVSADTDRALDDAVWQSLLLDAEDPALWSEQSMPAMIGAGRALTAEPEREPEHAMSSGSNPASEEVGQIGPSVVATKKKKKRRRLQKEELDALRGQVRSMEERLLWLRGEAIASHAIAAGTAHALQLLPDAKHAPAETGDQAHDGLIALAQNPGTGRLSSLSSSSSSRLWQRIAQYHKQQTCRAVMENIRLRAVLEGQNAMARNLQSMMRQRPPMTPLDLSPYLGAHSSMRIDAATETQLFASLAHDLNTLYTQTDAVMQATGVAHYAQHFTSDPAIRIGASGFFLEHNKILTWPFGVGTVHRTAWSILKRPMLYMDTAVYTLHHASHDTIHAKIVQTLPISSLPHRKGRSSSRCGDRTSETMSDTETVVTIRLVIKQFVEHERVVFICKTLVDTAGALSIRVREQAWFLLQSVATIGDCRDPAVRSVGHTCIRMSPEMTASGDETSMPTNQRGTTETDVNELSRFVVDCWELNLSVLKHVMETVWTEERTVCA